jgi:hypothetical protein
MASPAGVAAQPNQSTASTPNPDRSHLWLPLIQRLTQEVPGWVVLKNSKAAMKGVGDIDSFADESDFPEIERVFRAWAADHGLQVAVICLHNWRGPIMVAIRDGDPYLFSLDVKVRRLFRGSSLIETKQAQSMALMDDLGYRRLREGPEGILKLLFNGMDHTGVRNDTMVAQKGVLEALRADPEGAMEASRIVGFAAPALRSAARAAIAGGWSRRDLAAVEAWCYIRSIARPDRLIRQVYWRKVVAPRCAFFKLERRRIPDDREAWLRDVAATHPVSGYLGIVDAHA